MYTAADRSNPVAIVTGAGSGIGSEVARILSSSDWRLVLAGRRREPLEALARSLGVNSTLVHPSDLADPAQVESLVRAAVDRFGRIDALVNNAGDAKAIPIDKSDLAALRAMFDLNSIAPAYATHLCWPVFLSQRRGCIVNVSSMATHDPYPGFFAYAASKAAVNLMARSCAKEGERLGIRAFAVAPAAVETPLLRSLFDPSAVSPAHCLSPGEVAHVIVDCIQGRRDRDNGRTIFLRREGAGIGEFVQ